jgi:hypothetical protein
MNHADTRTSKPRTGATGWTGWVRRGPGRAWRAVCQAQDIGECHRLLLELAGVRSGDRFITRGDYPREG